MSRPAFWNGLETTGYLFEMKVAEALDHAYWNYIPEHSVAVLNDQPNLPVEETSIDFKAWKNNLNTLIEARRAYKKKWILFRKPSNNPNGAYILTHQDESKPRKNVQFHLRIDRASDRAWSHSQCLIRLQTYQGIYTDILSFNNKNICDVNEDTKATNSEIRKGAKQASIATIGVINDDYSLVKSTGSGIESLASSQLYFPVIVTAANVCTLDIPSKNINIEGLVPETESINLTEVPWAIYRYSLPRSLWLPIYNKEILISNLDNYERLRKLDIFIVNINHIHEFFQDLRTMIE